MEKNNKKLAWILLGILLVFSVGMAAFFATSNHGEDQNPESPYGYDLILQIMDATSVYGEPLQSDFDFTYDALRRGANVSKEELKEHITIEKEDGYDVGTYAINGTVDQDFDFSVQIIPGEYTITKATYDMSNVFFDDQIVEYDGKPHSIYVSGLVPEGVTPEYENNGQTEAGVYPVIARFKGDEKNYNPITTELKAELIILPADIVDEVQAPGSNDNNTPTTTPTEPTTPSDPNSEVPKLEYDLIIKINALYSVYGEPLKALDFDFILLDKELELTKADIQKFVKLTKEHGNNVGSYLISGTCSRTDIKVKFVTAHYFITKATYDMSKVRFDDQTVTFDGKSHSLFITGDLPKGVTVKYQDNGRTSTGRYKVVAHFTGDSKNYELIPDMVAYLTIEEKDTESDTNEPETEKCPHGNDPDTCPICNKEPDDEKCPHGNDPDTCPICNKKPEPEKCPHGKDPNTCPICTGKECEHGNDPSTCPICHPKCPHGKDPSTCPICTGKECEHGNDPITCPICHPNEGGGDNSGDDDTVEACPHGKDPATCPICTGKQCEHGNDPITCPICHPNEGGGGNDDTVEACPHGKDPATCPICTGKQCEHGNDPITCPICHPNDDDDDTVVACPHGKDPATCPECNKPATCEHGNDPVTCPICNSNEDDEGGSDFVVACPHGKDPATCPECNTNKIDLASVTKLQKADAQNEHQLDILPAGQKIKEVFDNPKQTMDSVAGNKKDEQNVPENPEEGAEASEMDYASAKTA